MPKLWTGGSRCFCCCDMKSMSTQQVDEMKSGLIRSLTRIQGWQQVGLSQQLQHFYIWFPDTWKLDISTISSSIFLRTNCWKRNCRGMQASILIHNTLLKWLHGKHSFPGCKHQLQQVGWPLHKQAEVRALCLAKAKVVQVELIPG